MSTIALQFAELLQLGSISHLEDGLSVKKGEDVEIRVPYTGSRYKPKATWFKDDNELKPSSKYVTLD